VIPVHRYLVVANQTLGGVGLRQEIRKRHKAKPCSFYILVPNTHAVDYHGVPAAGGHVPMPTMITASGPATDEEATVQARYRLDRLLHRCYELGAKVEGQLGDADPLEAIGKTLADREFDEVIISTLPPLISKWLRADLPRQVRRRFGLPVTVIISKG
jgi:hypothetical protein